jgi:nucleoside 2-deoxyribosyltransferase
VIRKTLPMANVVYLAGPEVFLPNAVEIGAEKISICNHYGLEARFPLDPALVADGIEPAELGHRIFERCVEVMDECGVIIANMTPFRGISMDVGTAVEVGYMYGRGCPVFGYTNVATDYFERVRDDGFLVETFGFVDNLMCEGPVWRSGHEVVRTAVTGDRLLTDLTGFERCVELAAAL